MCACVLWGEEPRRAHSAVRLRGLVQNAAGSSPVSALSARSMLATAGSNAIAAGTVPTKRFRCKALRTAAARLKTRALRAGIVFVVASLAHLPVLMPHPKPYRGRAMAGLHAYEIGEAADGVDRPAEAVHRQVAAAHSVCAYRRY